MIHKLTIVGVGLIGGSLARALRAANYAGEVTGFGRSLGNLQQAVELGVIDHASVSLRDAARDADMVVLAVPVCTMPDLIPELVGGIGPATVMTDVGSVKQNVIAAARGALGSAFPRFVPGHPIAGTEQSGVAAARADLFAGRLVLLTPEPDTDAGALASVQAMWEKAGAEVKIMNALEHDQVLAASSHLPHLLAYALVDMLVRNDNHRAIFACAGGGFRDFTRIAASDPVMWRDICLANRGPLLEFLKEYRDNLGDVIAAIEGRDAKWLVETFMRAKHARDQLFRAAQED